MQPLWQSNGVKMNNPYDYDDEEPWECDKFDECFRCKNRFTFKICEYDCDVGESFEEIDPDEVDKDFL